MSTDRSPATSLPAPSAVAHRTWLRILLVVLVNFGLRIGYSATHPNSLTDDADGYLAHARMIADDHGFAGPSTGRPTAFRPPGYPSVLAGPMRFGMSDAASVATVSVISAMSILWLIKLLGLQLGFSNRTILVAQLAAAMDPLLVRYSVAPMTEVPCAAVLLGAIVVLNDGLRATTTKSCGPRLFIAGCLFGIGAMVRPTVAVSCAIVSVVVMWRTAKLRQGDRAESQPDGWRRSALLLPIGTAMILLPWIVRNERVFGKFIPATTHGGYTLALGNNADFYRDVINGADEFPWDGANLDAWQQQCIATMQQQGVQRADEPAEDAWYYRSAIAAMRSNPMSCFKACVLRLRRFWSLTTADAAMPPAINWLIGAWYAVLWCGLVGSIVGCCRRGKSEQSARTGGWLGQEAGHNMMETGHNTVETGLNVLILWGVVLSFVLMHTFYWTDTRMRAPIMPILIVLSVSGWTQMITRIRGRQIVAFRSAKAAYLSQSERRHSPTSTGLNS